MSFFRKKRKTKPEGIYAVVAHTETAKTIGGTDREIIVVNNGRQLAIYPAVDCYINLLTDRGIPVIDVSKSDLPLEEWERSLYSSIDLGKVKFY